MATDSWIPFETHQWEKARWLHQWEYDPREGLKRLSAAEDEAGVWEDFWNYLHHQGDVCERSYLTVVALARLPRRPTHVWQLYSFVAAVEIERHRRSNPELPAWLREDYSQALEQLAFAALEDLKASRDDLLVRSALAVVALARGQLLLGEIAGSWTHEELAEMADERIGWSALYDARRV